MRIILADGSVVEKDRELVESHLFRMFDALEKAGLVDSGRVMAVYHAFESSDEFDYGWMQQYVREG